FLGTIQEGIWIEVVAGSEEALKALLADQKPLKVCFQTATRLVNFPAKGIRFEPEHRINKETVVAAILVEHPQEIKNVQRRNTYRVHVAADAELGAKMWSIPEHVHLNDRPMAVTEIAFELADISIGGIGIRLPAPAEGQKQTRIVKDQRLRVEMNFNDQKILFDGRFRPPPPTAKVQTAGVVFKNLEADMEGRQKLAVLTKIVAELQREEVRRARVDAAA
ncbi:MAG TPA: hypothetical protein VGF52_03385, partial [Tepidisphaeraceae bacterium]